MPRPAVGQRAEPRYRPVSEFVHMHAGRAAVICGGGPSLPEQLGRAPADAIYFSANAHLLKLRAADYIVAVDDIEDRLREHAVTIVGPRRWADIRLFDEPVPASGLMAAYVAWLFGCSPIILAGMDLYGDFGPAEDRTRPTYFHDAAAKSSGRAICVASHIKRWSNVPNVCTGGTFAVLGGPLEQLFPLWPHTWTAFGEASREAALARARGVRVRFLKDGVALGRNKFKRGDEWEISKNECFQLCGERKAVKLGGAKS